MSTITRFSRPLLRNPALSPDGLHVAFTTPTALCTVRADGPCLQEIKPTIISAGPKIITARQPSTSVCILKRGHLARPVWSQDGQWIAAEEWTTPVSNDCEIVDDCNTDFIGGRRVVIMRPDGSAFQAISEEGWFAGSLTWLDAGVLLYIIRRKPALVAPNPWSRDDPLVRYDIRTAVRQNLSVRSPWLAYDRVEWLPIAQRLAFCTRDIDTWIPSEIVYRRSIWRGLWLAECLPRVEFCAEMGCLPALYIERSQTERRPLMAEIRERQTDDAGVPIVRPSHDAANMLVEFSQHLASTHSWVGVLPPAIVDLGGQRAGILQQGRTLARAHGVRDASWSSDGQSVVFVTSGRNGFQVAASERTEFGCGIAVSSPDLSQPRIVFWSDDDPAARKERQDLDPPAPGLPSGP